MELIVALSVTGMAVSAGYAALALVSDRQAELERASSEVQESASVRATLIDWLDGARIDPVRVGASFRGLDSRKDGLPDDALTFLTGAATPLDVARTSVTLRIARDSAGLALGLAATLRDWDGNATRQIMLVPGARSLDIRFLSGIASEPGWLPSWITASLLPAAVELQLGAEIGDPLAPMLRAPILVPIVTR